VRRAAIARALDAVLSSAPEDVEIVALESDTDLREIDFLVPRAGDRTVTERLHELERLDVVQVMSAGTDWIEAHVPAQATLCSARGARDRPVAEWVLGALLGASTGLLECAPARSWSRRHLTDLARWSVVIVGFGSIGRAVAARLDAFGAEVIGVATAARAGVHGIDELPVLLPRADAVVVLTPLTESTRGLLGTAELAGMRDGAVLINAGRGPVVDTDALLAEQLARWASGRELVNVVRHGSRRD
jgi:phosphoglycerate dehydrogenase-like enzyme